MKTINFCHAVARFWVHHPSVCSHGGLVTIGHDLVRDNMLGSVSRLAK